MVWRRRESWRQISERCPRHWSLGRTPVPRRAHSGGQGHAPRSGRAAGWLTLPRRRLGGHEGFEEPARASTRSRGCSIAPVTCEDIDDDRDEDTEQAGERQREGGSSANPGRIDGSNSRSVHRVCESTNPSCRLFFVSRALLRPRGWPVTSRGRSENAFADVTIRQPRRTPIGHCADIGSPEGALRMVPHGHGRRSISELMRHYACGEGGAVAAASSPGLMRTTAAISTPPP